MAQDQLQQVRKELDAAVKDRRSALTKSAGLTKDLRASEAAAAECRAAAAAAEGVADKLRRQLEGKDAAIARWVKGPVSIVLYIVFYECIYVYYMLPWGLPGIIYELI